MDSVIVALAELIEANEVLDTERDCRVDTTGAPASIQRLVRAMCTHGWDIDLGEYSISDNGSGRVFTLGMIFELLEDLETELDVALAHAGAAGGPLDPDATLLLGPDGGGMSHLGVSWSGGVLSFCVVEFEEDPNQDGLVKHLATPGALLEYLGSYGTGVDEGNEHVAALKAAAIAAGASMEPAAPVVSRAPSGDVPRKPAPPAPPPVQQAPSQQSVIAALTQSIAADDLAGVDAELERLGGSLSGRSLLLGHVFVSFYNARDAHPATALKVAHWLAHQPAPEDPYERGEWLKGLSGGCELAMKPGDESQRYAIIQKALAHAEVKHDILHNAACALCALGRYDEALEAVSKAAALGYSGLASLRTDTDVVGACGQDAVDAAIARGRR